MSGDWMKFGAIGEYMAECVVRSKVMIRAKYRLISSLQLIVFIPTPPRHCNVIYGHRIEANK